MERDEARLDLLATHQADNVVRELVEAAPASGDYDFMHGLPHSEITCSRRATSPSRDSSDAR